MARFYLTFDTVNSAFEGEDGTPNAAAMAAEVARVLRQVADNAAEILDNPNGRHFVRDINGNAIGAAGMMEE